MHKIIVSMLGAAIFSGAAAYSPTPAAAPGAQASAAAAATPPDFSGVYYPVQQGRGGQGRRTGAPPPGAERGGAPPRPTTSAPLSDGSQGRSPDAPSLTPEYMAKWEMMRKSRIAGSYEFDNNAKCLPPGMPAMMNMAYGMEVMQSKDKITFFSELNDALRRVYLDGRRPSPKVLDDPTYAGYSTGHWEGDTLVVDTVSLHPNSFIEGFTPHSEAMTVKERIRFTGPGVLEDRITVTDPKALTRPWETVKTYRKAMPGNDELREFACPEGLDLAK
jgi:hypothetical protein